MILGLIVAIVNLEDWGAKAVLEIRELREQTRQLKEQNQKLNTELENAQTDKLQRQIQATKQPAIVLAAQRVRPDGGAIQQQAKTVALRYFVESEWPYFDELIWRESGYNPTNVNKKSGACGLPQSLPCSKLPQGVNTPVETQLIWMAEYVRDRYQTPSRAIAFHNINNWY